MVSEDSLTVTDTITGLVWQRDGSGTRTGCSGSGNLTCTWAEAEAYCAALDLGGYSDWRLPARMELTTIVNLTRASPAIDTAAFPSTPGDSFWTSSPQLEAVSSGNAWGVNFDSGSSDYYNVVGNTYRVRCVRGSRCYPQDRFVVLDGGLVRDTTTKLVWQQQASDPTMTWAEAQTYCSSAGFGSRLPTLKELLSLVELTVPFAPKINETAFPNTRADYLNYFWTSSLLTSWSGHAYFVGFYFGNWGSYDVGSSFRVRCVR